MTKDKLQECLRDMVKFGWIDLTLHGGGRVNERSVDVEDLMYILEYGQLKDFEYDANYDNYKCIIHGNAIDGDRFKLIAGVNDTCQQLRLISIVYRG